MCRRNDRPATQAAEAPGCAFVLGLCQLHHPIELRHTDDPSRDWHDSKLRARLRRSLAGNDDASSELIVTEAPGYRLHVGDHHIDAQRFAAAIETARRKLQEREAIDAVTTLRDGLELWRGEAYDEFAHEEWAHLEAVRLEELRTIAQEELNDALLACGLSHDVVSEARRLVEEHPLRERLRMQLALALYRAGRWTEAECIQYLHTPECPTTS